MLVVTLLSVETQNLVGMSMQEIATSPASKKASCLEGSGTGF